jgi:hypothetical protein
VELWDTTKDNARLLLDAHSQRTEHIAFGSDDNVVFTNTNMPRAVLLPEISVGLILQTGWVRRIRYLDQSG